MRVKAARSLDMGLSYDESGGFTAPAFRLCRSEPLSGRMPLGLRRGRHDRRTFAGREHRRRRPRSKPEWVRCGGRRRRARGRPRRGSGRRRLHGRPLRRATPVRSALRIAVLLQQPLVSGSGRRGRRRSVSPRQRSAGPRQRSGRRRSERRRGVQRRRRLPAGANVRNLHVRRARRHGGHHLPGSPHGVLQGPVQRADRRVPGWPLRGAVNFPAAMAPRPGRWLPARIPTTHPPRKERPTEDAG
jgi:hypothetical protein